MDTIEAAKREVIACAHRLLEADSGQPWSAATRDSVARALEDHACLVEVVEAAIEAGKASWGDGRQFRAWLSHFGGE